MGFSAGVVTVTGVDDYYDTGRSAEGCQNDGSGECRDFTAVVKQRVGGEFSWGKTFGGKFKAGGKSSGVPLVVDVITKVEWTLCCCLSCPDMAGQSPASGEEFAPELKDVTKHPSEWYSPWQNTPDPNPL
jgi:hypothetical protein